MSSSRRLAAAFDLGTTTIAASLVEPATSKRLAMTGAANPQQKWGADVLARLEAAADPDTLSAMQSAVAVEMEGLADELLAMAGAAREELDCMAVAGNPAMEHIALGLPVRSLAYPPFLPLFKEGRRTTTLDLGWSREIPAYLFPLPGGFVGGDLVAFLFGLASAPRRGALYLDMGTNAEIALFDGEGFLATSAAAGPAFEGGNLRCGMAALPGAVSGMRIDGEKVRLQTIAGAVPRGICGSGVMEAVAALLEAGVIDPTGRILAPEEIESNLANRVQEVDGTAAFVLHRDASGTVFLDQKDIRALQLAKGALRGGMEVLLAKAGLSLETLSEVVLTGSFGSVLSPAALKKIGVFDENMVEIVGFIREGALAGVERMLIDPAGAEKVEALASKVRVIPLSGTPLFKQLFFQNINFPLCSVLKKSE